MARFIVFSIFLFIHSMIVGQQLDMNMFKAKIFINQNKSEAAIGFLQNCKPDQFAYNLMGQSYYLQTQYVKAIRFFLLADSMRMNSSCYDLAKCYARLNNPKQSIFWLQKYLLQPTKIPELEILRESAFEGLRNNRDWLALWKNDWYSESDIEKNAIKALILNGNYSAAQDELDRYSGRITPRHYVFALQAIIYEKQKRNDQALSSINQALDIAAHVEEYLVLRAKIFYNLTRYRDAVDDITKALKLNPYNPDYFLLRIESSRMAGNLDLAEDDLLLYKELFPDSAATYRQMGLLENAKGHYHNALDYYNKTIQKEKGDPRIYLERGINKLALTMYESADEDFGMALDIDPSIAEVYFRKGYTQVLLGDSLGACNNLNKAKQLGSKEAAKLLYKNCK